MMSYHQIEGLFPEFYVISVIRNGVEVFLEYVERLCHIPVIKSWRTSWAQSLRDANGCWQSNREWKIYYSGLNKSVTCLLFGLIFVHKTYITTGLYKLMRTQWWRSTEILCLSKCINSKYSITITAFQIQLRSSKCIWIIRKNILSADKMSSVSLF